MSDTNSEGVKDIEPLLRSLGFKNLIARILRGVSESSVPFELSESDHKSVMKEIKDHAPFLDGTIDAADLTQLIKSSLYDKFPRYSSLVPLLPEKPSGRIDADGAAELVIGALRRSFGIARFSFPLGDGSAAIDGRVTSLGALGRFVSDDGDVSETSEPILTHRPRIRTSAQVDVKGFLFDGADALVAKAAERFSSLFICGWLSRYIELIPAGRNLRKAPWEPKALLVGNPSSTEVSLSLMRRSLGDTEALCRRSLVNVRATTWTLAQPGMKKVTGVWNPSSVTEKIGKNFQTLDQFDAGKMRTAFHFFSASLNSSANTHALLNLVISFESLLGWDLNKMKESDKEDPRERRARIEARLEAVAGPSLASRRQAINFITELYALRNKIAHGKLSSIDTFVANRMMASGLEYFRSSCLSMLSNYAC